MQIISTILNSWNGILLGVFWLSVMISVVAFIHEFGHYIVARMCGVKVEEFAIGMGKELVGFFDKRRVRWKICMFPIGGYVKLLGQSDVPKKQEKKDDNPESFENKNPWQKIAIAFAGPFANFLLTLFILILTCVIYGKNIAKPVISDVLKGSPAYNVGILPQDEILQINGVEIEDFNYTKREISLNLCNQDVDLLIKRGSKTFTKTVVPGDYEFIENGKNMKYSCILGVQTNEFLRKKYSFFEGVGVGFNDGMVMTKHTVQGVLQLLSGKRSVKDLSGPIRIGKISHEASKHGIEKFLMLMAVISIGVGVMNLIPIPVLDGGHILMNFITIVARREIPAKIQHIIYNISFGLIILLMLTSVVNDFLAVTR